MSRLRRPNHRLWLISLCLPQTLILKVDIWHHLLYHNRVPTIRSQWMPAGLDIHLRCSCHLHRIIPINMRQCHCLYPGRHSPPSCRRHFDHTTRLMENITVHPPNSVRTHNHIPLTRCIKEAYQCLRPCRHNPILLIPE